jgi:hypothetical protein
MIARRGLVALLLVVLSGAGMWAAAPLSRLTPGQQKQLVEAERWFTEVNRLYGEGKIDAMIAAAQKGLALERFVFGGVRVSRLAWLAWCGIAAGRCPQTDLMSAGTAGRASVGVDERGPCRAVKWPCFGQGTSTRSETVRIGTRKSHGHHQPPVAM